MRPLAHSRIIIASLGLAAAGLVVGLAMPAPAQPPGRPLDDSRVAVAIWNDSLSLVGTTTITQVTSNDTPAPTPPPTPSPTANPTATPAPTSSPCPANLSITNTGANSHVSIHCSNSVTTRSGSTSSVNITSSSTQTSTGGHSSSSSNTSVIITND
jgi:hypothetical protein